MAKGPPGMKLIPLNGAVWAFATGTSVAIVRVTRHHPERVMSHHPRRS
jgi:hypothetical protein